MNDTKEEVKGKTGNRSAGGREQGVRGGKGMRGLVQQNYALGHAALILRTFYYSNVGRT